MAVSIPPLRIHEFRDLLVAETCLRLEDAAFERLHAHYQELARWSPNLSLIGPGTAKEVVGRHFAESLAAVSLLACARRLVDLGSGAGFPGLVLAAVRPDLEVVLVEPRTKKAAFLRSAARKAGLSCDVLDARVDRSLSPGFPSNIDVVTVRALRLTQPAWSLVTARLSPAGRILRWVGPVPDSVPRGFAIARQKPTGDSGRKIEELVRESSSG